MKLAARDDSERLRPIPPLLLGWLLGSLVGVGEVLAGMLSPSGALTHTYALEAALLYGATGAILALATALAARLLGRRATVAAVTAVLLGFYLFVFVAGLINMRYLPEAGARQSLAITAVIAAGAALLASITGRLLERARLDQPLARPRARLALALLSGAGALSVILLAVLPEGSREVRVTHPGAGLHRNVLFIVIDALRYDHLSLNGYARPTSPRIDAWAAEAVVFDNAAAQAPWTKPSTATLLTGLYPSTHGVNPMASGVPATVDLLPAMLRHYDFRTAVFTANYFITPTFGFDRGTQHFYSSAPPRLSQLMLGHLMERLGDLFPPVHPLVVWLIELERTLGHGGTPEGGLSAEGLARAFWAWLDTVQGERFFAYLHLMEPHAPYDPPEPYDTLFMPDSLIVRPKVTDFPTYTGFLPFAPGHPVSPDSLTNMVALYDGSIRLADFWVGELIRDLKARGLYDRTLIVLTADHGEEFYEHQGWGHGHSLHEELIHVPLMLSGPGLEADHGRRLQASVRHIDLVPTILDVCGLPEPEGLPGASLLPILRGEESAVPPRLAFSEVDFGGHGGHCLREGSVKVIRARHTGRALSLAYDLAADPGELHDLAGTGTSWQEPLETRMEEIHALAARGAVAGVEVQIDEATREKLKGIGYLK